MADKISDLEKECEDIEQRVKASENEIVDIQMKYDTEKLIQEKEYSEISNAEKEKMRLEFIEAHSKLLLKAPKPEKGDKEKPKMNEKH